MRFVLLRRSVKRETGNRKLHLQRVLSLRCSSWHWHLYPPVRYCTV